MTPELSIAVVQPRCEPLRLASNAIEHANRVRAAQTRVVVFPELSITGYELDAPAFKPSDRTLEPIADACAATGSIALAGAPIEQAGRRYIAVVAIDGNGVEVVYRKSHLGDDEARSHSAGDGPTAITVDGWRLGIGTCKDTGVAAHTRGTAALNVDVYVAGLVHAPDELQEQDARALRIAATCDAYVAFASAAGRVGSAYKATAGGSAIWSPDGEVLARAGRAPGDLARAILSDAPSTTEGRSR